MRRTDDNSVTANGRLSDLGWERRDPLFEISNEWLTAAYKAANSKHTTREEKESIALNVDFYLSSLRLFSAAMTKVPGPEPWLSLLESVNGLLLAGATISRYRTPSSSLIARIEAVAHSNRQSNRGRKSGDARRAKRKWAEHARQLITEIVAASPHWGRDRIATQVAVLWKIDEDLVPSHETLKDYVEELEKNSCIPTHAERKRRGKEPVQPG
jgi:hypothetical protein